MNRGPVTAMLALLTLGCAHQQPERTTPRQSPEGDLSGAGGVRLHYRITGRGPDTVVVLHGGPGLNMEGLQPDLEPLERDHAVLYYDQRGSGRSDLPDSLTLTADAMVEDLESLRQAFHMEQLTLLGHSWGGGLALLYAMQYPHRVRRMVLVASLGLRGKPYLGQWFATQSARRDSAANRRLVVLDSLMAIAPGSDELCREWFRLRRPGILADARRAGSIKGDYCAGDPNHLSRGNLVARRVLSSFMPRFPDLDYDWRPRAALLVIPTLVVHGTADPYPLAAANECAAVLRDARLLVFPHAGHIPQVEAPERFFPAVETFLHGTWPSTASRPSDAALP